MTFTDLLEQLGIEYVTEGHRHCRKGWIQFDCPFCGAGSGKFHMGYRVSKGYLSCWRCGGHKLAATISELTGKGFKEARRIADTLEGGASVARLEELESLRKRILQLPKGLCDINEQDAFASYIQRRGFELSLLLTRYRLRGLGPLSSIRTAEQGLIRLPWRVFIPICDRFGATVSWTTRSIQKNPSLRYISAPDECELVSKKDVLFAEEYARHAVCVVEGPFDAMAGGPGFVATLGTAYSRAQVLAISKYPVRAICFDSERTAQAHARELSDELSAMPGKTYNIQIDGKDLAEDLQQNKGREIRALRRVLSL